jgi:hypothetical protein
MVIYHLAKLLREEQKWEEAITYLWSNAKHLRKELKKLTFNWGMYNQKDPLKDKAGLIRALDLVHKADRAIKLDILKQQYYYNNVNTNKGGK